MIESRRLHAKEKRTMNMTSCMTAFQRFASHFFVFAFLLPSTNNELTFLED